MEKARIIREAINYALRFHGRRIVVKIDNRAANGARENGVIADIVKIRQTGVEVTVVTQASQGIDRDLQSADKAIRVISCGETEDGMCDDVATRTAVEQNSCKLIFVTTVKGVYYPPDILLRQLSISEAERLLGIPKAIRGSMRKKISASVEACRLGVERVHIISGEEGSLISELFTCDGVGTMIHSEVPYQTIRQAKSVDVQAIADILKSNVSKACFDAELIGKTINSFWVFLVDDDMQGCMQLIDHPTQDLVEIDCLAVTERYMDTDTMRKLLERALEHSKTLGRKRIILGVKDNIRDLPIYPWFLRLGFIRNSAFKSRNPEDKSARPDFWVYEVK